MSTLRIALVEDNARFRQQLVERLGYFEDVEVSFDVGSAEEFRERLADAPDAAGGEGPAETSPDVVLVDIGLPGASGIELVSWLAAAHPSLGALMLTVFEEPDKILAAIQAGASGYLLKDAPAERIVAAAREVQAGGVPLSRPVARHVLRMLGTVAPAPAARTEPETEPLSAREVELLEQIVAGDTEAVIAERLCISPHTVRTHVKNIYRKLRVNSRAAAVRVAYERRLLDPGAD